MKQQLLTLLVLLSLQPALIKAAYIDSTKALYQKGEEIKIIVKELDPQESYWIGIYPKYKTNNWHNVISWPEEEIQEGTLSFEKIYKGGEYEARLFYEDSYRVVDRVEFDIQDSKPTSSHNNSTKSSKKQKDCGTPWQEASLTTFESYPTSDEEGIAYNGYEYEGKFQATGDTKHTKSWVKNHKIVAVHQDDWEDLKNKKLNIKQGKHYISAIVLDACNDEDCDGCCSANRGDNPYLIDMESYTAKKFGATEGTVEFQICEE